MKSYGAPWGAEAKTGSKTSSRRRQGFEIPSCQLHVLKESLLDFRSARSTRCARTLLQRFPQHLKHSEAQSWKKTERFISKKIEELFRINGHLRIQRNPQVAYNLGLTWEKVQKCLLQQVSWSSHPISPTKRSPLAVPLGKAVGESWDFSVPKPMHLCRSHTPSYHLQGYNDVPFSPANFFLSYGTSGRDRPKCPKETNINQWWARSWSHLKPPISGWLGCGAVSISSGMFLFFLLDISQFYRWFSRINVQLWKLWKGFRSSMFDWFGGAEEMALLRVFKGGGVLTTTFVVSVEFQVVFPSAKVRSSQANTKGIGMEPNLKICEWNVHPEARLGLNMVRLKIGYHHVSSCVIMYHLIGWSSFTKNRIVGASMPTSFFDTPKILYI